MSSQAKSAKRMIVTYNGYVLAETTEVTAPKFTVAKDDGTDQLSTHKVHLAGESEFGDLTITCYAVDDVCQTALEALAYAKTTGVWKLVYPSTFGVPFKTYVLSGFISGLEFTTPKTGRATMKLTLTPIESITPVTTAGAALTTPFVTITDNTPTGITLTPTAAADAYTYDGTALQAAIHLHVTPTATTGTIYVDGAVVATGAPSGAIAYVLADFPTGSIKTIFVMVVESDTKTPKIYQLRITRGTA
jgi:hypothetical protein